MTARTGVLVFEGGGPAKRGVPGTERGAESDAGRLLALVRQWTALDTAEKFLNRPEVDVVVVATDSGPLAGLASEAGLVARETGPGFHFGAALAELITRHRLERVVYLGGGSAPLLAPADLEALFALAEPGARVFVSNNVQSPDIIALGSITDPSLLAGADSDNQTLFVLEDAGYERRLLPDSPAASFDLDTPADVLFLAYEARRLSGEAGGGPEHDAVGRLGPRAMSGLAGLDLDLGVLERAAAALGRRYAPITLIGRVSGSTMNDLNENLRLRLRVMSEERGMKALGRIGRGEVRSVVGLLMERVGPRALIAFLEEVSEAVFWDTRVLMAHLGGWPEEADRFGSDLGRTEIIHDQRIRRLTEAAAGSEVPFVLGGHSVVSGGLRLLAAGVTQGRPTVMPDTGETL